MFKYGFFKNVFTLGKEQICKIPVVNHKTLTTISETQKDYVCHVLSYLNQQH